MHSLNESVSIMSGIFEFHSGVNLSFNIPHEVCILASVLMCFYLFVLGFLCVSAIMTSFLNVLLTLRCILLCFFLV